MSSKISPCSFWDQIPTQPSSISRDHFGNLSECPQRSHHVVSGTKSPPNLPLFPGRSTETPPNVFKDLTMSFLGPNPRPTFLYFPTVLPRPAKVLQKTTRPDDGPTTPGGSLGEACGGWRRLLREEARGKLAKAAAMNFRIFMQTLAKAGRRSPRRNITPPKSYAAKLHFLSAIRLLTALALK